jgi:tRNA1Val (adenine37-N6)-methyltransferase
MAPNPYFQFKQFLIYQDKCAMKVNTDGVLLGAWTDCTDSQRILDIGTGTGLIALMLAQRSNATIDAIEIDKEAATQATQNCANSVWKDRISVHYCSLQNFAEKNSHKYDLIVSNPPYFIQSLKSPTQSKNTARHTDSLSFEELITGSKKLLSADGKLSVILPFDSAELFIKLATENDLILIRKTIVFSKKNLPPKRILLTFALENADCLTDQLVIETEQRHHYSEEFKKLTAEFYL